jgi:hypothetical protein
MPSDVVIHVKDATVFAATWRDVFIELWLDAGKVSHMQRVRNELMDFAKRRGGKVAVVTGLVHAKFSGMSEAERAEVNLRVREMKDRTSATCLIIAESGFTASLVRSVIAGLSLVFGSPYPNKVFNTRERACEWLAPYLAKDGGRVTTAAQLLEVVAWTEAEALRGASAGASLGT